MRYTLLALLFSFLWASAFIAVKTALRSSPPLFLMWTRFVIAGSVLLVYARLRGSAMPDSWRAWWPIVLLGLLNHALYLGLTSMALQHLSAGMGAVLASTNPLMLALVAPWVLGERWTVARLAGMITSFAGVTWVMWSRLGSDNRPAAMAVVLIAIAFLVTGTIVFKKLSMTYDLLVLNGGQLLASGLVLAVPSVLVEPLATVTLTPSFLVAMAYLVAGVSWVGMITWFWLLTHGDATRASAWFFLNPVLGLFLGALVLGEPLRVADFVGSAAVALGIYVVQRS